MKSQDKYVLALASVLFSFLFIPSSAQTSPPAGIVKGKVKEAGGKSLEGVTVRAVHAKKKDSSRETQTDAKGDFELSNLETGEYSFIFEKKGYKTFTTRKMEVTSGETIKLSRTIELPREGEPFSVIRGAVFYGVGYTLANATVIIERIDGGKRFKQETISREGGEFAFRLKAEKAKYRITATARGFQPNQTEIDIESDEVRNISLTLQTAK